MNTRTNERQNKVAQKSKKIGFWSKVALAVVGYEVLMQREERLYRERDDADRHELDEQYRQNQDEKRYAAEEWDREERAEREQRAEERELERQKAEDERQLEEYYERERERNRAED